MKLKDILEGLEYSCIYNDENVDFSTLVNDSRKIEKGCVFICIEGANFDGHSCIKEAFETKLFEVQSIP